MWFGAFASDQAIGAGYHRTTTLACAAAENGSEVAIAVAIARFGAASGQVLAEIVRPLTELPVLMGLVCVPWPGAGGPPPDTGRRSGPVRGSARARSCGGSRRVGLAKHVTRMGEPRG